MPYLNVLQQKATEGLLPHAVLLTHDEYTPALTMAKALAQSFLGERDIFSSPDFRQFEVNTVEDARVLVSVLSLSAFSRRAILITKAHEIPAVAANILLKTLEEPPAQTLILLAATNSEAILPTVRSRLVHFKAEGESGVSDQDISALCEQFLQSSSRVARLLLAQKSIDAEQTERFLICLYKEAMNKDLNGSGAHIIILSRAFKYLRSNVQAAKILAYVALRW